ncbi:hypothetical protein FACS189421_02950 [Bacteroidia bacterium]|nr:hypothetical protein FACS189421_02950 [Bacteroidia bacterium]
MDEFCANKDTQLRRCACSSRYNEFNAQKKKLDQASDKMLDFSERLLAVNMDKEDAAAMNRATEGELAFQQSDQSASQKILNEISKKLKSSTTAANNISGRSGGSILTAINLTLDTDGAFDGVDFMMGAGTVTQEGERLFRAALPVCRDIAKEVCAAGDVGIAESAYSMAIEQDCTTVAKAYDSLRNQALSKTRDSAALLEMSRLDNYQTRNKDDMLTCKKKMLDMLTDSAVCGDNLDKCLDWSGKYIDPSTGMPFLTNYLYQLAYSITRPAGNEKWATIPANAEFVRFLNTKKKYLEPATENCQVIADSVWTEFLEDALPQIQIAQNKKLEDMRQSCTSITTGCLDTSATSIANFDARALSVFGVAADFTVNQICSTLKEACSALLSHSTGGDEWNAGMTAIAADKTYDTILRTCLEVGKACIVQNCQNAKGNFGLCEDVISVNRTKILNGTLCWPDVQRCVQAANGASGSGDAVKHIIERLGAGQPEEWDGSLYSLAYPNLTFTSEGKPGCANAGDTPACFAGPKDLCGCECGGNCNGVLRSSDSNEPDNLSLRCALCRLSERVWGNCEAEPANQSATRNKIIPASAKDTVLSWFADNTNTAGNPLSCRVSECPPDWEMSYFDSNGNPLTMPQCFPSGLVTSDKQSCSMDKTFSINGNWTNCCLTGIFDSFGNCCADIANSAAQKYFPIPTDAGAAYYLSPYPRSTEKPGGFNTAIAASLAKSGANQTGFVKLCTANANVQFIATYQESGVTKHLFCLGGNMKNPYDGTGGNPTCTGKYMVVDTATGMYSAPSYSPPASDGIAPNFYFFGDEHLQCAFTESNWGSGSACAKITGVPVEPSARPSPPNFFIKGI